jgi:transcriptional regulator with XRE-family HTH domain
MRNPKKPDRVDVEVGVRIRIQRLAIGLSQTTLAKAVGVTFQQVQKYEHGVNRVGAGRLTKIAEVLRVPVSNLLGADESNRHERQDVAASPLKLLKTPGALRVLGAYSKISDRTIRRSIVELTESIAVAAGRDSKRV